MHDRTLQVEKTSTCGLVVDRNKTKTLRCAVGGYVEMFYTTCLCVPQQDWNTKWTESIEILCHVSLL